MNKNKKDWNKFKEENAVEHEEMREMDNDEEDADITMNEEPALAYPSHVDLEEQLTLAEQKAHENWEKSVRALAELDNVRRRMDREVEKAREFGIERFAADLLPIKDSIEQAAQIAEKNGDIAMQEGLELTLKLFDDVFKKFNVEAITPEGELFDPQQHEAMAIQDIPGTAPNTVIAVIQKGYKLSGRVIRPARVIVSKK